MAKYCDIIGFCISEDQGNGIFKDRILEKRYKGEIIRQSANNVQNDNLNGDLILNARINILADPYTIRYIGTIKYAYYMNVCWKVTSFELQYPRILISLGGVYNGKTN